MNRFLMSNDSDHVEGPMPENIYFNSPNMTAGRLRWHINEYLVSSIPNIRDWKWEYSTNYEDNLFCFDFEISCIVKENDCEHTIILQDLIISPDEIVDNEFCIEYSSFDDEIVHETFFNRENYKSILQDFAKKVAELIKPREIV
jgi:hypothetical protein